MPETPSPLPFAEAYPYFFNDQPQDRADAMRPGFDRYKSWTARLEKAPTITDP